MTEVSFDLTGKVALVTGATRGLGYAIATGLARAGCDVAVVARTAADTKAVAAEIAAMGRRSLAVPADVANVAQIRAMVERVAEHFGRIDILVNNVGFAIETPSFEVTEDEWDRQMAVNVKGAFFCCQAVGKIMARQGGGKIINLGSDLAIVGWPQVAAYCASKGGVSQITKVLALEWAKHNIQVNAIGPANFRTPGNVLAQDPETATALAARNPQGRLGEPEEVVGAVIYLASPASSRVTGHLLMIDGGLTAQ